MYSSGGDTGLTYVSDISRSDAIAAALGLPSFGHKASTIQHAAGDIAMRTWERIAPYDNSTEFQGITIPPGLARPEFVWDRIMTPGETRYFAMAAAFTAPYTDLDGLLIAATNFADNAHLYQVGVYDAATKALIAASPVEVGGNTTTPAIGLTETVPFNWQLMRANTTVLQAELTGGTSYYVVVSYQVLNYLNQPGLANPACVSFMVDVFGNSVACGLPPYFYEYPNNPVYNPTTRAYYETVLYDAAAFSGHGSSTYYKMWYDSSSSGGISLVTSPDGINWAFDSNLSGLAVTARHSRILYDASGFGIGAYYRIWYWDSTYPYSTSCTALPPDICMLRTAESVDGVNWTNDTVLKENPAAPLFAPSGFNAGSYGPADILYFPDNSTILNLTDPFQNRYVMYYNVVDSGSPHYEQIALAVSADGTTWSKVGPAVVLPHGPTNSWDWYYASVGARVLRLSADRFLMWYSGGFEQSNQGIGYAWSNDGINWVKYTGNPIFSNKNTIEAWRAGPSNVLSNTAKTYCPFVLYDPQRFSGHGEAACYKMWMTGAPTTNPNDLNIGYASSIFP
ncbi:hypothetical protein JZ785_00695 [Alicyclobacillus curvatus]|nr:hypothetical protein JZ785_00695 [Alicyclobacillus curvatus]